MWAAKLVRNLPKPWFTKQGIQNFIQNISGSMNLICFSCKALKPTLLLDWPGTGTRSHSLLTYGLSRAELPAETLVPWGSYRDPTEPGACAACQARATDPQSLLHWLKETGVTANCADIPEQLAWQHLAHTKTQLHPIKKKYIFFSLFTYLRTPTIPKHKLQRIFACLNVLLQKESAKT